MAEVKMHADELPIDAALVRSLLARQFPQWADLPLERVQSSGTDNALFRLGDDLVVRLPRVERAAAGIEKDFDWLPKLAPLLPVPVPVQLAKGVPDETYPLTWGVYRWLEGVNPPPGGVGDAEALVRDLVEFLQALHAVDLPDGPRTRRGRPLVELQDESARRGLGELRGMGLIDVAAASAAWDEALRAPDWDGPPIWVHGDLVAGNVLLKDRRLVGVIDWSLTGVGDPACDLIVAWGLLPRELRPVFRAGVGADDATWARGRGWALSMGLTALPYYKDTNPVFAAFSRHVIEEVLADTHGV